MRLSSWFFSSKWRCEFDEFFKLILKSFEKFWLSLFLPPSCLIFYSEIRDGIHAIRRMGRCARLSLLWIAYAVRIVLTLFLARSALREALFFGVHFKRIWDLVVASRRRTCAWLCVAWIAPAFCFSRCTNGFIDHTRLTRHMTNTVRAVPATKPSAKIFLLAHFRLNSRDIIYP